MINSYNFLADGGESGSLIRSIDWNNTILGDPDLWPAPLRTALRIILDTPFPMYIAWGKDFIQFYNDGYRPILGSSKHPGAMGISTRHTFKEIWHIIEPMFEGVMHGKPIGFPNFMLPLERNGYVEKCYFDFSYSPIRMEDGAVGGVLVTVIETTQKVNFVNHLAETNENYQFAIDAAELGTWDHNLQTNAFTYNQRFKSWFGVTPDMQLGPDAIMQRIIPSDRQRVNNAVEKALTYGHGKYEITYSILNAETGVEQVLKAKGKAYFDQTNTAYRFNGTLEDITEEITLKQSLVETEQTLRNVIEHAPVAMCLFKGRHHIVEIANEKMIELWGTPLSKVLNKPIFEGLPEAKAQGLEELVAHVYDTGERFIAHERPVNLPRNNQLELVFIDFVYEALKAGNGTMYGIIAVAIDVTEKVKARITVEQAEERARLATEAADLGTFDLDILSGEIIVSPRFNAIFDIPEGSGHSDFIARFHDDDTSVYRTAHETALDTGKLFYEVRILLNDQSVRWVRADGNVIYNKNIKPVRMLGTMMDITESKEADLKREEYIAIASHELRNPLTSLNLALELIGSTDDAAERQSYYGRGKAQINKLLAITNELLNVSKIAAGVLELKTEIFNLKELVIDAVQTFRITHQNKFTVSGDMNINLMGDKFRLAQVLTNFISNASKYSPEGSLIEVKTSRNDHHIKVEVKDAGVGIAPDKIKNLFKKFIRLETNRKVQGFGLGLYISEQIVRKHGGTIGVESEKGVGSTFWFTIPF